MKREKKLFIGCFNKSVILTYIGVIFALAGIFILIDLQEAEANEPCDVLSDHFWSV